MGIRLYIRNTADVNSENEICLGKLYAYAVGNENFESVKYMIDHHCFYPEYWEYFHAYHDNYDNLEEHVDCLACAQYLDYGEFAVFNAGELFEFLIVFANDCNKFWKTEYPDYKFNVFQIMGTIANLQMKYRNSVFEIRQGA